MNRRLLLEVYTEEIPSSFFAAGLLPQLRALAEEELAAARLTSTELKVWGTPRRLAVAFEGVPEAQAGQTLEVKGPPASVAFDAEGNPTKAALGFAEKVGVAPEALVRRQEGKAEYVWAEVSEEGQATTKVAGPLFERIINRLTFPKTMRWNKTAFRFARPIKGLLGLYGNEQIAFSVAGLESGRLTWSHPFAPQGRHSFELGAAEDYEQELLERQVQVDPDKRQADLLARAEVLASERGGVLYDRDKAAYENCFLIEWPTPFAGHYAEEYLALPVPILTTVMRKHQKYFPLVTAEGGPLPYFIGVRDGDDYSLEEVIHGNERVIRARLADAAFYFENDRKQPLKARLEELKTVTFEARLGTLYEKTERLQNLAGQLASALALESGVREALLRAARLAKCDLVTDMVQDFDELQGVMGRHYALLDGESEAVAQALEEQYMPKAAGADLPKSLPGALLSLADKLDTVVGCLAVGYSATGSADPFGLRRSAYALVALCDAYDLKLELSALAAMVYQLVEPKAQVGKDDTLAAFAELLTGRVEAYLRDEGLRYDTLNAALASGATTPRLACLRARTIEQNRDSEAFVQLATAAMRPINIVRAALKKGQITAEALSEAPNEALFNTEMEQALFAAFQSLASATAGELLDEAAWQDFATRLTALTPVVDKFFDEVLVMDSDLAVQQNRLRLMAYVARLLERLGDFTQLVI